MRCMPTGIVTGASRGLGLALARALDERGWELVVDARGRARARSRRRAASTESPRSPATSPIPSTGARSSTPPGDAHRPRREQREPARAEPAAAARRVPARRAARVYEVNVLAPLALRPARAAAARAGGARARHHLRRGRRAVRGLGRLRLLEGRTRAAGARSSRVEHPELRVYGVDPGDMRTQMHQEAFPARTSPTGRRPRRACPGCSR